MGSAGFFPGLEMGITVSNRQSSGKTPAVNISLCNLWLDFVQCLRRKHSGQTDEQTDGGDYNIPFVFFKKKRGDKKVVMAVILVVVNLVFYTSAHWIVGKRKRYQQSRNADQNR